MKNEQIITLGLSVLALFVSIIASIYSAKQNQKSFAQSLRNEFVNLLKDLMALELEIQQLGYLPQDSKDNAFYAKEGKLVEKRLTYTRQCVWIVNRIPKLISDSEYSSLANILFSTWDYKTAEVFHKKAISLSESDFSRLTNLRFLAIFYYNTDHPDLGKETYIRAILGKSDDVSKQLDGYTYHQLMISEGNYGRNENAVVAYNKAIEIYLSMANQAKASSWIQRLDQAWQYYKPNQD